MKKQRLIQGWEHTRGGLGGVWEVWRGDLVKRSHYNVPWEAVELPHCFNASDAVDPDTRYYQGPGWYRTKLKLENPYPGGRTLLHFEGAGQRMDVYVFTKRIASHVGGYDEFTVDITDAAERLRDHPVYQGAIPVAVQCDNSRDLETIPSDLSDFCLYGGLYRYVNLVYVPAVSIEAAHVPASFDAAGRGMVSVQARLHNPRRLADPLTVTVRIEGPDGSIVAHSSRAWQPWEGECEIWSGSVDNPFLWSPDSPALYRCVISLENAAGQTAAEERFGFRSFEFIEHGPFLLNGQRLLLRGTHRHEDHAGVGAAMTEETIAREMQLIKEMGVNFIRLGHYQQSRIVLEQCDELGLLVWEEIPWCRGGLGGGRYRQQCRDMLRAMIEQHRNHPSVILWGLGNENDWEGDFEGFDKDAIRAFMKELHALAHQLDSTRKTAIRRCDFCKDVVDVYSPSLWAGWYGGRYVGYKEATRQYVDQLPRFLHVEWGADSHAGRHAEYAYRGLDHIRDGLTAEEQKEDYMMADGVKGPAKDGDWSETYFCDVIDWHLKEQETMEWLTGAAQWTFKDFATPGRPDNPVPYVNQKGVVQRDLAPKESYYVFQSYWTSAMREPMARLYGHTWPIRWGAAGEERLVKVYSNCESAELFLNGVSCGMRRRDSQDFPAAGLRWKVVFREGGNHLKVIAQQDGVRVEDEITQTYLTRPWGKPAKLKLEEVDRQGDIMAIQAWVLDEGGLACLDCALPVRFGLIGDGRLIDNQGTPMGSRQVACSNGRAAIRLDTRGGRGGASVRAAGLPPDFLDIL